MCLALLAFSPSHSSCIEHDSTYQLPVLEKKKKQAGPERPMPLPLPVLPLHCSAAPLHCTVLHFVVIWSHFKKRNTAEQAGNASDGRWTVVSGRTGPFISESCTVAYVRGFCADNTTTLAIE